MSVKLFFGYYMRTDGHTNGRSDCNWLSAGLRMLLILRRCLRLHVCYAWLITFSVVILDGRITYFTSAATVIQILEVLLNEVKVGIRYRKGRSWEREKTKKNHYPLSCNWFFPLVLLKYCRSRWPRVVRRGSAAAWLLGSRFRIPLIAWMFVP
jgi:hypothetical protein